MSCCLAGSTCAPGGADRGAGAPAREDVLHASREAGDGLLQTHISVPGAHCGGCIRSIEKAINAIPGVQQARVNLSAKRLVIHWRREEADPDAVFAALKRLGYEAYPTDAESADGDPVLKRLLLALGVAGFAAGNIMLLSVSVWSGAEGTTRDLFHWISALIAIPAVGYAGQPFFRPAVRALAAGRLNMDVPISLAVLLAVGMSLYETATHGAHAYFDASVTLLFFLLIGRTLDHVMRGRARNAVGALRRLMPGGATVVEADGSRTWHPVEALSPGQTLFLAAGERLPVDARVAEGSADIDLSVATGESVPVTAAAGRDLPAGALLVTGPLTVTVRRASKQSFLAEMAAMLEAAEGASPAYRRLADRAAAIYAPVVHLVAFAAFAGWLVATGDWHRALYTAIALLIITCPCALGLAVPIVQVVAAGRLYKRGVMTADGAALEKLAGVDRVVFDKTGTLTAGAPEMVDAGGHDRTTLARAAALAALSRHPYAQAVAAAAEAEGIAPDSAKVEAPREVPGRGIEGRIDGVLFRLGRADWALAKTADGAAAPADPDADDADGDATPGVVFSRDGAARARFRFRDQPRPQAAETLARLEARGFAPEILSGDHPANVRETADALGVARWQAGLAPADKIAHIRALQEAGHRVLMVGDGINDAPALSAADVSMAPGSAADIGRRAADFVFLHEGLDAVPEAIAIARRARRLIRQNFGLAIVYNMIAVPVAAAGLATPLVAAIAMSGSSLLVISNAMRLELGARLKRARAGGPAAAEPAAGPLPTAEATS